MKISVAVYSCHGRSWACCGKYQLVLFSLSFEFNSPYFLKIVVEIRKDSGSLNDCLISVDGTHVCIPQQGPAIPGHTFSLLKFSGKCGLQYKIGVDILAANIVWINGSYAAGKYPDIIFFAVAWLIGLTNMKGWKQTMGTLARLRKRSSAQNARRIPPKIKQCRIGCGVNTSLSIGDWKNGRFRSQCTALILWNMGMFFGPSLL